LEDTPDELDEPVVDVDEDDEDDEEVDDDVVLDAVDEVDGGDTLAHGLPCLPDALDTNATDLDGNLFSLFTTFQSSSYSHRSSSSFIKESTAERLGCISEAWARLVGALELEEEEELALDIAEDGCDDDDPVPTSGNTGKTLEYFTNAWVMELSTSRRSAKAVITITSSSDS